MAYNYSHDNIALDGDDYGLQAILDYYDWKDWSDSFLKHENYVQKYLYGCFLVIGTIGNIPCAFYLSKYCRTAWSVCFYLILSLIFGLIELYIYCGNSWFFALTGNNLTWEINILSNAVCKVFNYFINVLIYFLSWVTVATSIETMITIKSPQRMYKICTLEKSRSIVLLILVLVVSLNLHFFWTIGLSTPDTDPDVLEPMCHNNYQPQLSDDVSLVLPLSEFLLDNFIPFVLVSVFTIISIVKMSKQNKKDVTFELKKYIVDVDILCQLQLPTVIMLFTFAFLKAFQCVEHITRFVRSKKVSADESDPYYLQREVWCLQIINSTMRYFYISFVPLLFIIASKRLRTDIIKGIYYIFSGCYRKSRYKLYISPDSSKASNRTSMSKDMQSNGERPLDIKCTNV